MSDTRKTLPPNGSCALVCDQLSAYLDGELTPDETAVIEAHLAACPDCARLCTALRGLRSDIAAARLDPPPALHGRIMARVRREKRMQKLRRVTALASAGVAAMFCFVVVGGAMMQGRGQMGDAAPMEAGNHAKMAAEVEYAADVDGVADAHLYSTDDAALTGAVIDTTIEAELTLAATGLSAEETVATKSVESNAPTEAPPVNAAPLATTAPAATTALPETTAAAPAVQAVTLAESERDLARLIGKSAIGGLSTNANAAEADRTEALTPLSAQLTNPDACLATEQVGTLCTLELREAVGLRYVVYDLISGKQLTLGDFLGDDAAPARYGATAETVYRPTAAGLWLALPTGEVTLPWTTDAALAACVTRFEMTKTPLCALN